MNKALLLLAIGMSAVVHPFSHEIALHTQAVVSDIDLNGNVYAVTAELDLVKFEPDKSTTPVRKISVANFGMDPLLDATNPLEIFLFYPSTGKVYWLDNQLNFRGQLDIFAAGIIQPIAFGRANDGNIWVFDQNTQTLKKLDRNSGDMVQESVLISGVQAKGSLRIYDNGYWVVFQDFGKHVFTFDQNLVAYGGKTTEAKLMGLNKDLCIMFGNLITRCDCKSAVASDTLKIPVWKGNPVRFSGDYYLTADSGVLYRYKQEYKP